MAYQGGAMGAENERTGAEMAKYIDRDSLIEWLKRIRLVDLSDGLGICRVIMEDDFQKAITNMPENIIVDVAPVLHGRWEHSTDEWFGTDVYTCSKCRESYVLVEGTPKENLWHYCPNCGAKMYERSINREGEVING